MNDSNQSLRFARTYREATGMDAVFDDRDKWDRRVGMMVAVAVAFVIGLIVGSM